MMKQKIDILELYIQFQDKLIEQLNYHKYILLLVKLEESLLKNGTAEKYLDNSDNHVKDMIQTKERLGNRDLKIVTREFVYRNYYQIYEEFISSLLIYLYKTFPNFLKKENENVSLHFDNIFEDNDIESIRNSVIELRVKGIIQSNNVVNIFTKIKSIFGIDIKLKKEEMDFLMLFSLKRNLLVHNSGKVNSIFLSEVKRHKIECSLKINDDIIIPDSKSDKLSSQILPITKKIYEAVISDLPRLEAYNKNF